MLLTGHLAQLATAVTFVTKLGHTKHTHNLCEFERKRESVRMRVRMRMRVRVHLSDS